MTRVESHRTSAVPVPTQPWRLAGRTRKAVLLAHILSAGTWLGLDAAMAVLVLTAVGTDSAAVRAHTLQSLRLVTVWPMFVAATAVLVSGLLLGLGSKWGVLRYWWVVLKLAVTLVFGTLIVVSLRGGVSEAAWVGQQLAAGADPAWNYRDLLFPVTVSPTGLTLAFVLSVFKPGGRMRRAATDGRALR